MVKSDNQNAFQGATLESDPESKAKRFPVSTIAPLDQGLLPETADQAGTRSRPVSFSPSAAAVAQSAAVTPPHTAADLDQDASRPVSCSYYSKSFTYKKTHGAIPRADALKSQKACYNRKWTISYWKKDRPGKKHYRAFTCNSWRHPGDCAQKNGAQTFARIKTALEKYQGWTWGVLTYRGHRGNPEKIYRGLGRQFQHFRQWVSRRYGKLQYIVLIEQHADGWPHVNFIFHNAELNQDCRNHFKETRRDFKAAAIRHGFGYKFWLDNVYSNEAISGYFVKLAGEVAKTSQAPCAAPKGFNRLRSSKDLLPKKHKDDSLTGEFHTVPAHIAVKTEYEQMKYRFGLEYPPGYWDGRSIAKAAAFTAYQNKYESGAHFQQRCDLFMISEWDITIHNERVEGYNWQYFLARWRRLSGHKIEDLS